MPIPLETNDIEAVDEPLRDFYVEADEGTYRLDVDGLPDVDGLKSALNKERTTAKELSKQVKEISRQWEGYSKEEIDELLAKRAEFEDVDASKIEEQIATRLQQNDETWKSKYGELENRSETLLDELSRLKVRDRLSQVGGALGIGEGAQMEDFLARGQRVFKMSSDGEVKPVDAKSELIYGKDGVEPLTMDEFVKGLAETAPHLFKISSGGGASNSGGAGPIVRAKSDLKTVKEKAAFIEENGQQAYLALPRTR